MGLERGFGFDLALPQPGGWSGLPRLFGEKLVHLLGVRKVLSPWHRWAQASAATEGTCVFACQGHARLDL